MFIEFLQLDEQTHLEEQTPQVEVNAYSEDETPNIDSYRQAMAETREMSLTGLYGEDETPNIQSYEQAFLEQKKTTFQKIVSTIKSVASTIISALNPFNWYSSIKAKFDEIKQEHHARVSKQNLTELIQKAEPKLRLDLPARQCGLMAAFVIHKAQNSAPSPERKKALLLGACLIRNGKNYLSEEIINKDKNAPSIDQIRKIAKSTLSF